AVRLSGKEVRVTGAAAGKKTKSQGERPARVATPTPRASRTPRRIRHTAQRAARAFRAGGRRGHVGRAARSLRDARLGPLDQVQLVHTGEPLECHLAARAPADA